MVVSPPVVVNARPSSSNSVFIAPNAPLLHIIVPQDQKNQLQASVYLGPFLEKVNISVEGNFNYQLLNAEGQIVQEGAASNSTLIENEYHKGLYILKMQQDNKSKTYKLIKE